MRVKITYATEIEEVPEEIEQLYTYVSDRARALMRQTETVEDFLASEDLESSLPVIDKMRRTLAAIDQRLSDIEMIAQGYVNYTNQGEEDVQAGRPPVDPTGNNDGNE